VSSFCEYGNERKWLLECLMMEAEGTSEASGNFCENSRRNIPEDSQRYTRRHEKLKSRGHERSVSIKRGGFVD
jgi:hypothetical protein